MGFFSNIKNFLESISDKGRAEFFGDSNNNTRTMPQKKRVSEFANFEYIQYEKIAENTQKTSRHLERYKASEITLLNRHNALIVSGDWAWLDFYDNGIAILTYDLIFDIANDTKPEDVAEIIRRDWEERRGIHRQCFDYYKRSEDVYVLKTMKFFKLTGKKDKMGNDIAINYDGKKILVAPRPSNYPISYLKYDGKVLSKLNNRFLTEEEKKKEWIDTKFADFSKFVRTDLNDFSKGDAIKIGPAHKWGSKSSVAESN